MVTRREALTAIGAGLVGSLSGCAKGFGGGTELQEELETVREATEGYTDHMAALDDGFKILGPYVPGMGWHFSHPQRIQDAAENGPSLENPPLLTYDNEMNLGSVEWAVPVAAVDDQPGLFSDGDAEAAESWHPLEAATHVFAVPDGDRRAPENIAPTKFTEKDHWAQFRPPDRDLSPGDMITANWGSLKAKQTEPKEERVVDIAQTHPDMTTLHAWVHAENPEGVFHPSNPEFAQGGGDDQHDHSH